MQTNNVTDLLGLNQWQPGDKLNTGQFTKDNELLDAFAMMITSRLVPTGTVLPYAGEPDPQNDPPGFLFLTPGGREVSRARYAGLFALIGVTYGSGDGSTTFTLPDPANRFILGYGARLGAIGGDESHVLLTDEMANHRHKKASYKGTAGSSGDGRMWAGVTSGTAITGYYTDPEGGDRPHNNMPPWLALAYIIKI